MTENISENIPTSQDVTATQAPTQSAPDIGSAATPLSTTSKLPMLLGIIAFVLVAVGAGFVMGRSSQDIQTEVVQTAIDTDSTENVTEPSKIETADFILDPEATQTTYSTDGFEGTVVINYNKKLKQVSPIPKLIETYPQLADATFYYHGDVAQNSILNTKNTGDVVGWHLVSAVLPVFGSALDPSTTVHSLYEAAPGEPETVSALVSPTLDSIMVLDCGCSYSADNPPLFLINAVAGQNMRIFYNFFHISADGSNPWKNSFLETSVTGNTTGGGGMLTVKSDTNSMYDIVYFAQPFDEIFDNQKSVDTIRGNAIYRATNQKNTYKAADGHKYEKHFMRAENGMTYLLYK